MPKPPLYAPVRLPSRLATAALLVLTAAYRADAAPPCAPCLRASVTPAEALTATAPLNGASVFVRVPAAAAADAALALRHIGALGGQAGLHLVGVPQDAARVFPADATQLAIEIDAPLANAGVAALKRALATARGLHPGAPIYLALGDGANDMADALRPYVDGILPPSVPLGDPLSALEQDDGRLRVLPPDSAAALTWLGRVQPLLPRDLAAVPARAVRCAHHALDTYLDPSTLMVIAVGSCPAAPEVQSDVPGARVEISRFGSFDVVRLSEETGGRLHDDVAVSGMRHLSAEEIVARHQAFVAQQSAETDTRISTAAFTLTFEAPGFPAPVSVTARTVFYTARDRTELQQRDLRVNGVSFNAHGGVPRLPILEPERVAAAPLTITLTDLYRYRLGGEDVIRGHRCYVIDFAPAASQPLAAGRTWIDERTFAMVRVHAVQTSLRGPVTASEQTDDFEPDSIGRWLPLRTEMNQTYESASFRTPIHRVLEYESHVVNAEDYQDRLDAAHASDDVMLRDTPGGYRYLRRASDAVRPENGAPGAARIEVGRIERVRTLAMGVLVDPDISRPLPFAGVSYADLNLFRHGGQLNAFLGGSYGEAAFVSPSLGDSRWRIAARASAIAVSYNDRTFSDGVERYERDIRQRPASASVALLHPLGSRLALRTQYEFDYVAYAAGDQTSPLFRLPAPQHVHGLRFELDGQRGGWQTSLWWSGSRRVGWRPWGAAVQDDYRSSQSDFQRFGAGIVRAAAVSPSVSARIEAAGAGGTDLDRFSRFAFGTFDNRLHGYPSALIRYDRGVVVRTAVAWSAGHGVRLDGFADAADVHDPDFGRGLRNYNGVGGAVELPAPGHTLAALEWAYGLQGRDTTGGRGTQVVRITAYKVF
ncbi:MAG TPA: hypothetical protein VL484_11605 [Vicinamibacterales bacterium]|nr:hypothetical protein [Vicinamibacterales bacterium]